MINISILMFSTLFQDVVEERFDLDYALALGVAGALVLLIASVAVALLVMRCRNRARYSDT